MYNTDSGGKSESRHRRDGSQSETADSRAVTRRTVVGSIATGLAVSGIVGTTTAQTRPVFEVGTESVQQPGPETWHSVRFQNTYDNPVVVMKPVSFNGSQPCHIRLRNVGSSGFEFKIEEWEYLNGMHVREQMSWIVVDEGVYTLSDGSAVTARSVDRDHTFDAVSDDSLDQYFDTTPVIFSQAQTYNGSQPIVTRHQFQSGYIGWRLQAEEQNEHNSHVSETFGDIMIEPGVKSFAGVPLEVGRRSVDEQWRRILFGRTYTDPALFADIQTYNGSNTAAVRYRNLEESSVEVFVEEEQSADDETGHMYESVGYMTVAGR